jgi:hypothetical protein
MDLVQRVAALTPADLAPVVRELLQDPAAVPRSWTATAPAWTAFSPSTRGVLRVEGTATTTSAGTVAWTAVLKVVGSCGYPGYGEPTDGNYWKREPLALSSGLLEQRTAPLVPVALLSCVEVSEEEVWLWLECLDSGDAKPGWDDQDRRTAAADLGAFNAVWAVDPPAPAAYPWLATRWVRGWVDYAGFFGCRYALEHPGCWDEPRLAAVLPADTRQRVAALLEAAEPLLSGLEALPVTLTHHDAQWRNLFLRPAGSVRPGRTVAVDWAFLGLAPVGADLGHLIGCDLEHSVDPAGAAAFDATVTEAYLDGLRQHGWTGDERAVLFARAASAALQMVPVFAAQVAWLAGEPAELGGAELRIWPEELAAARCVDVPTALAGWAAVLAHLLDLGDEARELAAALS